MRRVSGLSIAIGLLLVTSAGAQTPLTLEEAAALALRAHPALEAAEAGTQQAGAEVAAARSGFLPRVAWSGGYTRGNNPVYAFGTRLNQGRFAEANFAVGTLNDPAPIQNFQSVLSVEQTLFDANRTKHAIASARLHEEMSAEERRARELDVLIGVVRTYFGVVVSAERIRLAEQAVAAADADLRRAEATFEAGQTTRADVLAVGVHRAAAVQEHIRAVHDHEIARVALNDAVGLDLDEPRAAVTPLTVSSSPTDTLEAYLARALGEGPEARRAALDVDLSAAQTREVGALRWPSVVVHGVLQADREHLGDPGGDSWLAGVALQWNLWSGNQTWSKVRAARHREAQAVAQQRQVASATALRVRQAWLAFRSADERLQVADATVAQAEESLRIVRNRYESGLETVTELLRSETALTEARFRRLAARYEQRITRAGLEHAAGRLTADSEVMR